MHHTPRPCVLTPRCEAGAHWPRHGARRAASGGAVRVFARFREAHAIRAESFRERSAGRGRLAREMEKPLAGTSRAAPRREIADAVPRFVTSARRRRAPQAFRRKSRWTRRLDVHRRCVEWFAPRVIGVAISPSRSASRKRGLFSVASGSFGPIHFQAGIASPPYG